VVTGASRSPFLRSLPALILICLVVFAASPALHNPDCHAASPSQCAGCIASPAAFQAEAPQGAPTTLPRAGEIEGIATPRPAAPSLVSLQGRSPPA
jgi:hypothetical protein